MRLGCVYCVYVGAGHCGDNGSLLIKLYLRPVSCLCDFTSAPHILPVPTEHPLCARKGARGHDATAQSLTWAAPRLARRQMGTGEEMEEGMGRC